MTEVVEITGVANGGDGVCRIDGRVCFVPYALPGDRLRIDVASASRGVLRGAVVEVLEPSEHRSEPACGVFGLCGGCTWLHFDYPAQAEWKRRIVSDCFERIGKLSVDVDWLDDPSLRTGYRTRATFRPGEEGWGFFAGKSHEVVPIEECPLCHPRLNVALNVLRNSDRVGPVDVTVNPEGEEILVWTEDNDAALLEHFPMANSRAGESERSVFEIDGVPVVNGTFSQGSLLLNRILVQHVRDLIGDASSLLDLYCGSGNLSRALTSDMRVLGVDRDSAAVGAAVSEGGGEYHAVAEEGFSPWIARENWDVVVLDPPRLGAKRIVPSLAKCSAEAIVYVSCDPGTLARDAAGLVNEGWRIDTVTAVDMFPHTAHVEAVCHFRRG